MTSYTPVEIPAPNKKPDKQQALIEAARDLFTTVGYESTTMAEVAKKAGVAVGTVYLYFKNKKELLNAVKDNWQVELLRAMSAHEITFIPHHLRARPLIEATFAVCAQRTEMVQLMGLSPELMGEMYSTTGDNTVQTAIKALFDEGIEAGVFRPELDTEAAALLTFSMVDGALRQCFIMEGGKSQERYIDALVDALEHWLRRPDATALQPYTS
ncbi:MAG: TetR/AcrR family transcriptional regulator [Chloroflexota bacterium]|nr:TetR/AcrR family transcriptional regulator [Chloroflexota bacterium]